jgi:hypothetical protein
MTFATKAAIRHNRQPRVQDRHMTPKEGDDRPLFDIVSPEFDNPILETCMTIDDIARVYRQYHLTLQELGNNKSW